MENTKDFWLLLLVATMGTFFKDLCRTAVKMSGISFKIVREKPMSFTGYDHWSLCIFNAFQPIADFMIKKSYCVRIKQVHLQTSYRTFSDIIPLQSLSILFIQCKIPRTEPKGGCGEEACKGFPSRINFDMGTFSYRYQNVRHECKKVNDSTAGCS